MTGVQTCALPICFPVTIGGVVAGSVNAPAFSEWLDEHSYLRPDMAVVEKVHSMPGQGVASTFMFVLLNIWFQL